MSNQSAAPSLDSLEHASKKSSKKHKIQNLEKINWRIGESKFKKDPMNKLYMGKKIRFRRFRIGEKHVTNSSQVSYVASRWWQQFLAIPWPDKLFHSVACFVDGFDEDARMLRRSLLRYMNLALILVLRSISSAVKQRFPTLEHVVEAGFMTNQVRHFLTACF